MLRAVSVAGATPIMTYYFGPFVHEGTQGGTSSLKYILTPEGRILNVGTDLSPVWKLEYDLKDHLGNVRVVVTPHATPGYATLLQENNYYPFGMRMSEICTNSASCKNQYKYNGKELQTDFGLNWYDYGARFYDPALGRFTTIDPLTEKYRRWSPYCYGVDNPMRFTDPDGMGPFDEIANKLISKAANYIAQKVETAVVETGKAIVESAKSFASKLEVGVRLEGSASVSLGMQAGVKGEALGGEANLYSEDVINVNGNVEYTKKGGDSQVDANAEAYVKNDASDKRSNHSISVSESTPTPIGVIGLEQSVSNTSTNQQNNQPCNNSSTTVYSGAGWNGVAGAGAYYTNSTSSSGTSNEAGIRVGTSGSAALVGGASYDLSLRFFVRVRNDNE